MSKEAPRPFEDTPDAYRKAVEDLMSKPDSRSLLIERDDAISLPIKGRVKSQIPIALRRPRRPYKKLAIEEQNRIIPRHLRTHNMAQIALFTEEQDNEDVGATFNVTRQNVAQAVKIGVSDALKSAPQHRYRLSSLNFRKPFSDSTKDKMSLGKGGVTVAIGEAVSDGATLKDLTERFTYDQIANARDILENRQERVIVPSKKDEKRVLEPFPQAVFDLVQSRFESQRQFAEAVGVSETAVSHWRTGKKIPSQANLRELLRVLKPTRRQRKTILDLYNKLLAR